MSPNAVIYVLLGGIVLVNATTVVLWAWIKYLVRTADDIISSQTASIYTTYLFRQIMEGRFYRSPRMMAVGNPDRDPVIRAVRGSRQFVTIEWLASYLKEIPVNVVPFLI